MKFTDGTLSLTMVAAFSRPFLKLGLKVTDIMEAYYNVLETPSPPKLSDLITAGGNSYADLKLTVLTFGGAGRVDITPTLLGVNLRDVASNMGGAKQAKEHFSLCERTLSAAMEGVEISERYLRAQVLLSCEGGADAVEQFLAEKGNAAFRFSEGTYEDWKKQFKLEVSAVNPSDRTKVELKIEPAIAVRDLFVDFGHTAIGAPTVEMTVGEQFDLAEKHLLGLLNHIGLVSGVENGSAI